MFALDLSHCHFFQTKHSLTICLTFMVFKKKKITNFSEQIFTVSNYRYDQYVKAVLQVSDEDTARFVSEVNKIACILLVTRGLSHATSAAKINEMLISRNGVNTQLIRRREQVANITGGYKGLIKRLVNGDVLPSGLMGKWTPDFITGLKMSGVLRSSKRSLWYISSVANRPALKEAFLDYENLPFHCKTKYYPKSSHTVAVFGCWAFEIGVANPSGIGVLAGLFCGGRRLVHEGVSWLVLVNRKQNAELLNSYGIPYLLKKLGHSAVGQIFVSPFWGALLSSEMPKVFGDWFENWEQSKYVKPGMYPLLPWVVLRAAWGVGLCDNEKPKGLVPYLIDRNTLLENYKIGQRQVREEGLKRFGFTRLDSRLRSAWLKRLKDCGLTVESFLSGKAPTGFAELFSDDGDAVK